MRNSHHSLPHFSDVECSQRSNPCTLSMCSMRCGSCKSPGRRPAFPNPQNPISMQPLRKKTHAQERGVRFVSLHASQGCTSTFVHTYRYPLWVNVSVVGQEGYCVHTHSKQEQEYRQADLPPGSTHGQLRLEAWIYFSRLECVPSNKSTSAQDKTE